MGRIMQMTSLVIINRESTDHLNYRVRRVCERVRENTCYIKLSMVALSEKF